MPGFGDEETIKMASRFLDGIEWSDPARSVILSQQPFPTVLNHGATQAIATELGRLLLRTGCANLQDR